MIRPLILFLVSASSLFARDPNLVTAVNLVTNAALTTTPSNTSAIFVRDCLGVTVRVSASSIGGTITVSPTAQMGDELTDTSYSDIPSAAFTVTSSDVNGGIHNITLPPGVKNFRLTAKTASSTAVFTADAVAK